MQVLLPSQNREAQPRLVMICGGGGGEPRAAIPGERGTVEGRPQSPKDGWDFGLVQSADTFLAAV